MVMPGRKYSAGSGYRYGFNGKEEDDEVKGDGNQQDYGMRIYDTRLGRFLSMDPLSKSYPMLSPYQFAGNSPTSGIDLDGEELLPTSSSIFRLRYLGTTQTLVSPNHQFVVDIVMENIPKALNYKIPGPPLHPSGRDWDISKDGFHPAFGLSFNSPGSKSVTYFAKSPKFYDDPLDASEEELKLESQMVKDGFNKITNKIHYSNKWGYSYTNPSGAGGVEITKEYGFYKNLYDVKIPIWEGSAEVANNRQSFYKATNGVIGQIEKWPLIKQAFPFSMTNPYLLQNARVDLTNFVLDGTLPQISPTGLNNKQFISYLENIYTLGSEILKANNIEVRMQTKLTFNSQILRLKQNEKPATNRLNNTSLD
jgi:RHS repeat-associated protein